MSQIITSSQTFMKAYVSFNSSHRMCDSNHRPKILIFLILNVLWDCSIILQREPFGTTIPALVSRWLSMSSLPPPLELSETSLLLNLWMILSSLPLLLTKYKKDPIIFKKIDLQYFLNYPITPLHILAILKFWYACMCFYLHLGNIWYDYIHFYKLF